MLLGTYQRYVIGETLRAFFLAWLAITVVIVLFMVMAEATRAGLAPYEVAQLTPFVVPQSIPFTVPVALLFAVTVVYGRIASDNEVIALKAAGLSAWMVIWPALALSIALSGLLAWGGQEAIPRANHRVKLFLFSNLEDMLYKVLKKERMFNNPNWPFLIMVKDVEGRTLVDAIFKHRAKVAPPAPGEERPAEEQQYDVIVAAKKAQLNFDIDNAVAKIHLVDATIQRLGPEGDVSLVNDKLIEMPLPDDKRGMAPEKRVQERTYGELLAWQDVLRKLIQTERSRQAVGMAMWMGAGRFERVDWKSIQAAYTDYNYWKRKIVEIDTEIQFRWAIATGTFCFALLGAPVGILFARRDFLSAFITCFLPIILVYYPLLLVGMNLGKEDLLPPYIALWMGNILLSVLAAFFVLPSVLRH